MFAYLLLFIVSLIVASSPWLATRCLVLYVLYEIFCWEPLAAVACAALFLAYQVGKLVGLRSAAGEPSAPDRPSKKPDQTSTRRRPLFPMALKEHLQD